MQYAVTDSARLLSRARAVSSIVQNFAVLILLVFFFFCVQIFLKLIYLKKLK
jgi:hypothetical protein